MTTKRVLVRTDRNWCGEDLTYKAIVDDAHMSGLENLAQMQAYDNFSDFGGPEAVKAELFPDSDGDWTDEQIAEAEEVEDSYYHYDITDFDGTEEEWGWYELMYDCTLES